VVQKPLRNLVISGGASHGADLWGGTRAFLASYDPAEIAAASIGAVIGAGVALGKDLSVLEAALIRLFQKNRLTGGKALIRPHPRMLFVRGGGMHDWTYVKAELKALFGDARMGDCLIPLTIMVGDVYTGTPTRISSATHPDVLIWEALLCSTAIWPVADGQELPSAGTGNRLYVDGGWGNNVPIDACAESPHPIVTLYLAPHDSDHDGKNEPVKRTGFMGMLEGCLELALYVTPMLPTRREDVAVGIQVVGSGLDFDLPPDVIRTRVLNGWAQTRAALGR